MELTYMKDPILSQEIKIHIYIELEYKYEYILYNINVKSLV